MAAVGKTSRCIVDDFDRKASFKHLSFSRQNFVEDPRVEITIHEHQSNILSTGVVRFVNYLLIRKLPLLACKFITSVNIVSRRATTPTD
jgi:hypothetical protein